MKKFLKYTIYINLIVSILSVFIAFNFWEVDRNRAYIFLFLAVVTGFIQFRNETARPWAGQSSRLLSDFVSNLV